MNSFGKLFIASTLILSLILSACSGSAPAGELAPKLEGKTVDGAPFNLADLRGSYVVLDFWASWCGPCIREAPEIVSLEKEYRNASFSDAEGFHLVSVATEKQNNQNWQKVVKKFDFSWPYQLVEIAPFVRMSEYASAYGVTDIPSKFLIGPSGDVLLEKASISQIRAFLEKKK